LTTTVTDPNAVSPIIAVDPVTDKIYVTVSPAVASAGAVIENRIAV
jgi:hypothetical protein